MKGGIAITLYRQLLTSGFVEYILVTEVAEINLPFQINQDLRNEDLSLRPKRSVGKQSQDFCDYVAVVRPFRTCYANVMTQ